MESETNELAQLKFNIWTSDGDSIPSESGARNYQIIDKIEDRILGLLNQLIDDQKDTKERLNCPPRFLASLLPSQRLPRS